MKTISLKTFVKEVRGLVEQLAAQASPTTDRHRLQLLQEGLLAKAAMIIAKHLTYSLAIDLELESNMAARQELKERRKAAKEAGAKAAAKNSNKPTPPPTATS